MFTTLIIIALITFTNAYYLACSSKDCITEMNATSLHNIIKKQYVPNILLYGPSGSGKSSAAFLISKNITNINKYTI